MRRRAGRISCGMGLRGVGSLRLLFTWGRRILREYTLHFYHSVRLRLVLFEGRGKLLIGRGVGEP